MYHEQDCGRDHSGGRDHDRDRKREREELRDKAKEFTGEQYLRRDTPKKRVIKASDKSCFSSDWVNTEDTSRGKNSLYENPNEARLFLGRGFRASIDRREQKLAAKREAERHWSEKKLEQMTTRDWRIFKEDFDISYKGTKVSTPMRNWVESGLNSKLLDAVDRAGYKSPSPIQMAAIPLGLEQRDVIGVAQTGSGKTAAFVLPMLEYVYRMPPISEENEAEGPYALVLAPTRELARQIEEEAVKLSRYLRIKIVSIVGGQSIQEQGFRIRQGCEIVVATPGRLKDCLDRQYVVLNQCNYVVLDEADRMIDMGFEEDVVRILDAMPSSNLKPQNEEDQLQEKKIYRTTYMFSATMRPAIEKLARLYLRNPVVVTVGSDGKASDLIKQRVIMVKESEKKYNLERMINDLGEQTAIVFVNTKNNADHVGKYLEKAGYKVTVLHSGFSQKQREISLRDFKTKRCNVMVATDVAGRGIDIPDVAHVINFDMPGNIEGYTHRIGRTGRAGKNGVATTFLTMNDTEVFFDLKQMLVQSKSPIPPELERHEASKFKPGTIPYRPPRRNETLFTH